MVSCERAEATALFLEEPTAEQTDLVLVPDSVGGRVEAKIEDIRRELNLTSDP